MIETRISTYNGLSVITDLVAVAGAFVLAMVHASVIPCITWTDGLTYLNLRPFAALTLALALIAAVHLVSSLLYYSVRSPFGTRNLLRLLPRAAGLALADCAITLAACLATGAPLLPVEFFAAFVAAYLSGTIVLRAAVQAVLAWSYALKDNTINILIVGTNQRAHDFFKYIESNRFLGYRVVGFLDDVNYCGQEDVRLLGSLSEFASVARDRVLDTVVVFLPVRSYYDKVISIIEAAALQGIPVQHMYSFFDHKRMKTSPSHIGEHTGMFIPSGPANPVFLAFKRLFDIVFSLAALLATSPLLMLAAAAIWMEDRGPVFFIQSRVGYHKRTFGLLKLRTMVVDAEKLMPQLEGRNEMDGPVFKIKADPRVTRVGHVLRKFHIDELPQFVNVLLGDMSVVGPRPMAERDYRGFSEDWLRRRFSARPGITCTWQTLPNRNEIPFVRWMAMDMEYTENMSFLRDLAIIFRTALVTLKGTGR